MTPQEPDFFVQPFFNPVKYSTEVDTGKIYYYKVWTKKFKMENETIEMINTPILQP